MFQYPHHRDTLQLYLDRAKTDPEILCIALGGSVARGSARAGFGRRPARLRLRRALQGAGGRKPPLRDHRGGALLQGRLLRHQVLRKGLPRRLRAQGQRARAQRLGRRARGLLRGRGDPGPRRAHPRLPEGREGGEDALLCRALRGLPRLLLELLRVRAGRALPQGQDRGGPRAQRPAPLPAGAGGALPLPAQAP